MLRFNIRGSRGSYRITAIIALLLLIASFAITTPFVLAQDSGYGASASEPVQVFRLYKPVTGDHFYTLSVFEKEKAIAKFGYVDQGRAFRGYDKSAAGRSIIYRAYHPQNGDHFYTRHFGEYANALRLGYNLEGIGFRNFKRSQDAPADTTVVPVYRLYHVATGDHLYTTSKLERDEAISDFQYRSEGIEFFSPIN